MARCSSSSGRVWIRLDGSLTSRQSCTGKAGVNLGTLSRGWLTWYAWSVTNKSAPSRYRHWAAVWEGWIGRSWAARTLWASRNRVSCEAGPRYILAGTMKPSLGHLPHLRKSLAQGTRRASDCETIRCTRSPGAFAATGIDCVPTPGSQLASVSQMNSDPLSLLIRVGAPRRPITLATTRRTSAPVIEFAAYSTKHSRVYSSTNVSHLRGRPSAVRS